MNRTVVGVFPTYRAASDAVRELELLGISGGQVEVVTDEAFDVDSKRYGPKGKLPAKEAPVKNERTTLIVRPNDDTGIEQARGILDRFGAKNIRMGSIDRGAPVKGGHVGTTPDSSIGGPGTRGNDPADQEGRGKTINVHEDDSKTERHRLA